MSAALPPLRAPDPALLDLAPVGDAGAAEGKGAADAAVASGGGEEEAGLIKLGPLTLATGGLHRQFRLRQVRRQRAAPAAKQQHAPAPARAHTAAHARGSQSLLKTSSWLNPAPMNPNIVPPPEIQAQRQDTGEEGRACAVEGRACAAGAAALACNRLRAAVAYPLRGAQHSSSLLPAA